MGLIQNNIWAMKSRKYMKSYSESLAKSQEKLSSGFNINRAGDDSSGLGLSEKLRRQAVGLGSAQQNIQDGINMVQSADGAMEEIHAVLNRLKSLAVNAAHGTYDQLDRERMQAEAEQLLEDVDRIRSSTNFNGLNLLQGEKAPLSHNNPDVLVKGGMPGWVAMNTGSDPGHLGCTFITEEIFMKGASASTSGTPIPYRINHAAGSFDFSDLANRDPRELVGQGFYTTCCTCVKHYSVQFVDEPFQGGPVQPSESGNHFIYSIGIQGVSSGEELVDRIIKGTAAPDGTPGNPMEHYTKFVKDPKNPAKLVVYDDRPNDQLPNPLDPGKWKDWTRYDELGKPHDNQGVLGAGVAFDKNDPAMRIDWDVRLQIGESDASLDQMELDLPNMTRENIGLSGFSLLSQESALRALGQVERGISFVSQERVRMGAYQTRLEDTYKNTASHTVGIVEAESQIRDTDIADETIRYTTENILLNAAQAVLAQANMMPQAVLQLLK